MGGWVGGGVGWGGVGACSALASAVTAGAPRLLIRVLARPWATDDFCSTIHRHFVDKPKSLSKLLTYSPYAQELYVANRKRCGDAVNISSRIKDFCYAPQRFCSQAKTLCRLVITLDASLATAAQVLTARGPTSDEGRACLEMLQFTNEEVIVQLGMLADMAMQVHSLVRECDDREADESELPGDFSSQDLVLRRLFIEGLCVDLPGLTRIAIDTLRKPRTYVLRGGATKTLGSTGGPDPDVIAKCLVRMAALVALASKTRSAEFPDFELLAAFRVFALSQRACSGRRGRESADDRRLCLERLAACVQVSSHDLIMQYQRHEPCAASFYSRTTCSNVEAWAQAVERLGKRDRGGSSALLPVLIRFAAWGASSCEVERNFAKTSSLRAGQSEDEFCRREEDIIMLQADPTNARDTERICEHARKLWLQHAGRPRGTKRLRIDVGVTSTKVLTNC